MLTQPTIDKLKALKLDTLAQAWLTQRDDPEVARMDFDERFGLLVDAEWLYRENNRLTRLMREARMRLPHACVEDIEHGARRNLDRSLIRRLTTCDWIREHQHVVITGATGTGKTYVACALAQQACRKGHRTLYRRVPRLLDEIALARADGTYVRLLARLARFELLVLDDWAMTPLRDQDRHDLLEIFEDRDGVRSTIVTSQLPVAKWHDHLGDPTVADALLDRIVHTAHRIELKGPSRRRGQADQEA